ncbi:hypothetical protein RA266_28230, partial [Pseudomonas syringae pv. tagetis]|uniref:hypothetical protein n=1 Tax=Pseudomonas syringae group genomosp. 7 TaxID=251699 RepID=UPI00376FE0A7
WHYLIRGLVRVFFALDGLVHQTILRVDSFYVVEVCVLDVVVFLLVLVGVVGFVVGVVLGWLVLAVGAVDDVGHVFSAMRAVV